MTCSMGSNSQSAPQPASPPTSQSQNVVRQYSRRTTLLRIVLARMIATFLLMGLFPGAWVLLARTVKGWTGNFYLQVALYLLILEAALAHELGRWRVRHMGKGLGLDAVLGLACAYLASMPYQAGIRHFGFEGPADIAGFPLLVLALVATGILMIPLHNPYSRHLERPADRRLAAAERADRRHMQGGSREDGLGSAASCARPSRTSMTPHPIGSRPYFRMTIRLPPSESNEPGTMHDLLQPHACGQRVQDQRNPDLAIFTTIALPQTGPLWYNGLVRGGGEDTGPVQAVGETIMARSVKPLRERPPRDALSLQYQTPAHLTAIHSADPAAVPPPPPPGRKPVSSSNNATTLTALCRRLPVARAKRPLALASVSLHAAAEPCCFSSNVSVNISDINFTNSSGTVWTWANAVDAGKVQPYFMYRENNVYRYAATADLSMNDYALRTNKSYWVKANQAGNLTLPGIGGSTSGQTFNWASLRFHNGAFGANVTQAYNATNGWVMIGAGSTGRIYFYNSTAGAYATVSGSTGDKTTLSSYEGYFLWSNYNNIIMIRRG